MIKHSHSKSYRLIFWEHAERWLSRIADEAFRRASMEKVKQVPWCKECNDEIHKWMDAGLEEHKRAMDRE